MSMGTPSAEHKSRVRFEQINQHLTWNSIAIKVGYYNKSNSRADAGYGHRSFSSTAGCTSSDDDS